MIFNGFINCKYKKFIIDENNKKTIHNGKETFDSSSLSSWDHSWAIVVPDDIVVIDSDNARESEILYNIIKDNNLKCYVSKSKRGYHFYFKIPKEVKINNMVDASLPIGLVDIDFRSGQKTSYIIENKEGVWNEWLKAPIFNEKHQGFILDAYDLDEIPFWLQPFKVVCRSLVDMNEGDGRNDELFRYSWRLVEKGYNEDQIRTIFNIINKHVFKDSFEEKELEALIRFDDKKRSSSEKRWFDDKAFLHNEMAIYMSQILYCYKDRNGVIWYFDGKRYSFDPLVLEIKIAEACPVLKESQRKEVINFMKLIKLESTIKPITFNDYICCNNGLVNGITGEMIGYTPCYFITNSLDITYDANAYDVYVDTFLNEVLVECGDVEQRMIFEEFLGYTLISKDNFMRKMLFLIGKTAMNGKSTTLSMLQELLTSENYSTLKICAISQANDKVLPQLVDKLANIDDDADDGVIKGSGMSYIKTLISDDNQITVNPKFKNPYQAFIRAKFWVASNEILRTQQKGEGWLSRLLILAFNNRFDNERQKTNLKNFLKTDNAKSYLLNLAIKGFQRILANNNKFTVSKESEKQLTQYKIENDSVYRFLASKKYSMEELLNKCVKTIYIDYNNFMEFEENIFKINIFTFETTLVQFYKSELKVEIINNERVISKNSNNKL